MARKQAATQQPTRDLMVALPADIHKTLKLYCVQNEVYAKDVVAEALRRYLGIKKEEGK